MYASTGDGDLEWEEPDDENCHVEVAVCDGDDGRFLPELDVSVAVLDGDEAVAEFEPQFLWHPGLHHYGDNVKIPGDGAYSIRVDVEPPGFERHDEENGDRYRDAVQVTFDDVQLTTGQS
nr:iron transporter [Halorubellus sp. JP-L1]